MCHCEDASRISPTTAQRAYGKQSPRQLRIAARRARNDRNKTTLPCNSQGSLFLKILFFLVHSLYRGVDHAAPG
jgi:hypothetical protein